MALTTYITTTEANYFYPNDSEYSANVRAQALSASFGMLNSFIDSRVKLPVIGAWDGASAIEAPWILKFLQSKFYRYMLEFSNVGDTQELREFFDSIVETCRSLRQGEIDIPSLVYDNEPGWHVASVTQASNIGGVWVRGSLTDYRYHYRVVITSATVKYVGGGLTYSVYRSDSATAVETNTVATFEWKTCAATFEIRFDGQWTSGDEILIVSIPATDVNTPGTPGNYIKQGEMW